MHVLQPFDLSTGESDTKERLSALRTKVVLERAGSREADFVVVDAAGAGEGHRQSLASPLEALPEGYVPRAAGGPSFMDRKLHHLQVHDTLI